MNKIKYLIPVLLVTVLSGAVIYFRFGSREAGRAESRTVSRDVYYCPMHPSYTSDKPGSCPICSMSLVKKDVEPNPLMAGTAEKTGPETMSLAELKKMKPGQICLLHKCRMGTCMMAMTDEMARLGKCPHCGEDLGVLIKELLPEGYSHVRLSPEKQQEIGVETAVVEKKTLHKMLRSAGKIAYDPELYAMEKDYFEAFDTYRRMGTGQKELRKARLRLKQMGLNDGLIQEIESQRKPDNLLVRPGKSGKIWVYLKVYEQDFHLIHSGQKMTVEAPSIPGKLFDGVVRAVSEIPDPVTREVLVRGLVENPEALLKFQTDVNVVIKVERGEALAVPAEAVFSAGDRNIIFVVRSNGIFEPREVKPGILAEEGREILSGVSLGDSVVIRGNFLIDSESRLKASLEDMGSKSGGAGQQGGHQHGE